MNVRLSKSFEFWTNVWYLDALVTNKYDATVSMISNTTDTDKHEVSVSRIDQFMRTILGNAVMIRSDDTKQIERLEKAGIRTVHFPEEPFDQTLAIMLYCKLNAICAGNMIITGVDLSSKAGCDVNYMFDEDDAFGPFAEDGWWNDEEPTFQGVSKSKDKIIKLAPKISWEDFGLEWEVGEHGNVVTGNFANKKTPKKKK